jgi:hypothetical protein
VLQVPLDVTSSALRSGGGPAECFGDLGVAITRRVLVAHSRPGRRMAESGMSDSVYQSLLSNRIIFASAPRVLLLSEPQLRGQEHADPK